jgi:hypothetical protein
MNITIDFMKKNIYTYTSLLILNLLFISTTLNARTNSDITILSKTKILACQNTLILKNPEASVSVTCRQKDDAKEKNDSVAIKNNGSFYIYTGPVATEILLDKNRLLFKNATFFIQKKDDRLILKLVDIKNDGIAKLILPDIIRQPEPVTAEKKETTPAKPSKKGKKTKKESATASAQQPPEPQIIKQKPVNIEKSDNFFYLKDQKLIIIPKKIHAELASAEEQIKQNLFSKEAQPHLKPIDIEIPSDFQIADRASSQNETETLEFENVEVEVGCVEVCTD